MNTFHLNDEKAVMLHGYGEDWPSNPVGPDLINAMQVDAALMMVRNEYVGNIFLGAGNVDTDPRSIAEVMEGYLDDVEFDPVRPNVVRNPPPYPASTRDEMRAFRDAAHEYGWGHCVCIGIAGHGERIQRARDRLFPRAEYRSTEEVLMDGMTTDSVRAELYEFFQSAAYLAADGKFRKRERLINLVDCIGGRTFDIGGRALDFLNRRVKGIKKLEVKMGQ